MATRNPSSNFLAAVLGRRGAAALAPLAKADPGVAAYLPARAAVAWLATAPRHDGRVPGTALPCWLLKTEQGWVGDVGAYTLGGATDHHAAAAVVAALDAAPGRPDLRDVDLARLGKTVDALAKAAAKRRGEAEAGTGTAAAAIPAAAPAAAAAPTAAGTAPKKPKPFRLPGVKAPPKPLAAKLSLSEARHRCGACGLPQYAGGALVGCRCFAALAKTAASTPTPDGYLVRFGRGWDPDLVLTFLAAVR